MTGYAMRCFAAVLRVRDAEKNITVRPRHLSYLASAEAAGSVFARGPFTDGTGGLVIYRANSLEQARRLAEEDPYVVEGARELELHEWRMTSG